MKESDYTIVGERAIHMVGDRVAVVRNVTTFTTESNLNNDFTHTVITQNIVDPSYAFIDFVSLRRGKRTGEWFAFDERPVSGGFGTECAKTLAAELLLAVEFIAGGG